MSLPNKRSVRFNESTTTPTTTDQPPPKRSRPLDSRQEKSYNAPRPSALKRPSHRIKTKNSDRVNEDELDDIDQWNEREDGDFEDHGGGALPSQSELIEAKRKRREQRGSYLFNDSNNRFDEAETSLATEGIKIEPFHMREEETDGTGYFDGDTYVFRKNIPDDGEADAWTDTLIQDGNEDIDSSNNLIAKNIQARRETKSSSMQEDLSDLPKEQLYKRILPLMGDAMESVMAAIRRYGKLADAKSNSKNRRKKQNQRQQEANYDQKKIDVARSHLDDLTGAANALLKKGEIDVYDKTKQDILRMFPSLSERPLGNNGNADIKKSKPKWEYQGNGDNQIHGPFTTEQMIGWVQSGYFVGAQRVKIRTIGVQDEPIEEETAPKLSTKDDLLSDLMDDDDEEEEEIRPAKKVKESHSITVKGEWMWSNEIDYQKYL